MTVQSFVYESAEAASVACARKLVELLERALSTQPRVSVAVSGGTTPKPMFAEMAQSHFNWTNVHLFWVCLLYTSSVVLMSLHVPRSSGAGTH